MSFVKSIIVPAGEGAANVDSQGEITITQHIELFFNSLADREWACLLAISSEGYYRGKNFQSGNDLALGVVCKSVSVTELEPCGVEGNTVGSHWKAVLTYSNATSDQDANPIDEPWVLSSSFNSTEMPFSYDVRTGEVILNTAGDPLDPGPTRTAYIRVWRVSNINVYASSFDVNLPDQYIGTINDSYWNGYQPDSVLCTDFSFESHEATVNGNQFFYYTVNVEFQVAPVDEMGEQSWKKFLLSQGYYYIDPEDNKYKRMVDDKKEETVSPRALKEDGDMLKYTDDPNDAAFIEVYANQGADFNAFGIIL